MIDIVLKIVDKILDILNEIIPPKYKKWVVAILFIALFLIIAGLIGHEIGRKSIPSPVLSSTPIPAIPPIPSNVSKRFDFENVSIDNTISLDICDAIPPTYYENCDPASPQLYLADGGFTGKRSLGWAIESRPGEKKVYSVNFPIASPPFVDLITVNVYIPNSEPIEKVWLLAQLQGKDEQWVFSEFTVDRAGWIYLLLDLRQFNNEAGIPANQIRIGEIDVDFFTRETVQKAESVEVQIDDMELYYPISRPFLTPTPNQN